MIGGADESVLQSGDWLTWIKILSVSNIAYIPQHLNNFRYHDNSVIAKARKTASEQFLGRDNIIMRKTLHKFFIEKFVGNRDFKTIIKKNYNLLLKEYAKEAYYHANKGSWIKGLSIIIKISLSSINNFVFLLNLFLRKVYNRINDSKK